MTRNRIFNCITSLCAAAIVAVASVFTPGIRKPATVEAASGTGLEDVAAEWSEEITDRLVEAADEVTTYENSFLDENKGDIRKLSVDIVTKNVFNLEREQVYDRDGERRHIYNFGNGWTMDYSMTRNYGSYYARNIWMHSDAAAGSLVVGFSDNGKIEFYFHSDNGSAAASPCEVIDMSALEEPTVSPSVIIAEGSYVASSYELALVGLLGELASESDFGSNMSKNELEQARTNYTNYCNNSKGSAWNASRNIEGLMTGQNKDIRDITVSDVLRAMSGGKYDFEVVTSDENSFSISIAGSKNLAKINVSDQVGGYSTVSPIEFNGEYKKTGNNINMTVEPVFGNNQYTIKTKFSSKNSFAQVDLEESSFILNEPAFNNYHIQVDGSDKLIDCAVIGQLYGVLVFNEE